MNIIIIRYANNKEGYCRGYDLEAVKIECVKQLDLTK